MKCDPNTACVTIREVLWWALLHDLVAHPLMAVTFYWRPAIRFHDWTSQRAWPRVSP
jgi:hypothetical protein